MEPLRIFIGWDKAEIAAYTVAQYSIIKNSSRPVSITPLNKRHLPWFTNADNKQSTEFAFTRFLVPYLSGYEGYSLFMDCDMLVRGDVSRLFEYVQLVEAEHEGTPEVTPVYCVKHSYFPNQGDKFLGQEQTIYTQKNWSSVMLFNNAACKHLDPVYVNTAPGLDLHQFKWAEKVGELPRSWNYLVGEEVESQANPDIAHFTRGGPYFTEYANSEFAQEWYSYWADANSVLDKKIVGMEYV